jgi:hypothetical protein
MEDDVEHERDASPIGGRSSSKSGAGVGSNSDDDHDPSQRIVLPGDATPIATDMEVITHSDTI